MTTETVYILLFVIATMVAILSRRFSIPYTIALVLAGLVLGALQVLQPPRLTRDLLFTLFLPGLLFEAAFHLEFDAFRRNWIPITGLALPGLVLSLVVTAALLYPLARNIGTAAPFGWHDAFLFGAIVASTDPIAVVALLKSLGVPRRLSMLLEGESLLNDGTSVVVFSLILSIALGDRTAGAAVVTEFARVVGGGIVVGIAVGMGLSELIRRVDDAMIEITLTTIAAYGSFLAADNLRYSGVIATVVAGLVCGNYGARKGMSASSRVATESFWEYVAFAFNSIVFLLIGFELQLHQLVASWLPITLAYIAVTVGRAIVLTGVSATLAGSSLHIPPRWTAVLSWGGLRGGLSMVLALGLPQAFPQREFLITLTFGVVFLSILIQGFTMAPLVRRLGLVEEAETARSYERSRGRLFVSRGALEELERMIRGGFAEGDFLTPLRSEYDRRIKEASREIAELRQEGAQIEARSRRSARLHLLASERGLASEAYGRGLVGTEVYHELVADIDARALELETPGERRTAEDTGSSSGAGVCDPDESGAPERERGEPEDDEHPGEDDHMPEN